MEVWKESVQCKELGTEPWQRTRPCNSCYWRNLLLFHVLLPTHVSCEHVPKNIYSDLRMKLNPPYIARYFKLRFSNIFVTGS